jgi:hypothetical protein
MPSKFVQVMVCRSDDSPEDKKLSQGLAPRLKLLAQRGIVIGGSGSVTPGQNVLEEMMHALLSSRVAILLMSTDWLLDPLMRTLEPLLLERANSGDDFHLLPVRLRPFLDTSSAFAHIAPVNSKLVADMTLGEREKTWESVCSQILEILGIQFLSPSLHSILTEQYIQNLSALLTKNTGLRVRLFRGIGNGTYNHGLGTQPDRVLLASSFGQEIVHDQVWSTQVHVAAAKVSPFTGLAIARKG